MALALTTGTAVTALVGFAALGAGTALVVPTLFSAAARLPGLGTGAGIVTVSTFGWAGFVCGPPLIGGLAGIGGLRAALALIPALTLVIALATTRVGVLSRNHRGDRDVSGCVLVVMGVSGSGKSTVGARLAQRLGWDFAEGDDLHPAANVAKMAAGQPLTDADREPWLAAIAAWIGRRAPGWSPGRDHLLGAEAALPGPAAARGCPLRLSACGQGRARTPSHQASTTLHAGKPARLATGRARAPGSR